MNAYVGGRVAKTMVGAKPRGNGRSATGNSLIGQARRRAPSERAG